MFGEPSEIFRRVWMPLERALDEESAYVAAKLAALESLRGGFTTVCEAGTRAAVDAEVVAAATRDAGIRCVLGLNCDASLAPAAGHLARYESDPLIHPSLAISLPESGTDRMLYGASKLCAEAGTVFQIHVNEHLASIERSLENRGLRPLEHLAQLGVLGPQVLAAHVTLVTVAELRLLADSGTAVSYNPVASAWKGNAVAPALTMAASGIRFGLGTDGTRSDGFRLMDSGESAQRLTYGIQTGDSSCGAGWTWLHHATAGGAAAAALGEVTGQVAVGRAADFLLVDLDVPELRPSWDLTWELVRVVNRDQITAVVVAGVPRLWQGWPIHWDGRGVMRRAEELAHDTVSRAQIRRVHQTADKEGRLAR